MGEAIKQAEYAGAKGEIPIGCVIVLGGKIISRGQNQRETKKDATAHAEIIAIRRACKKLNDWRLSGAEIYVTLEPCPMCAGAIMNARIDKIYFGSYEKKSGACGSAFDVTGTTALNSRAEVVGGVREDECRAILTRANFCELYKGWIDEHIRDPHACPLNDLYVNWEIPDPCAARIFLNR